MTDEELRDRALSITLKHADVVQAEEVVALAKRYAEAAKPRELVARQCFGQEAAHAIRNSIVALARNYAEAREREAMRIAMEVGADHSEFSDGCDGPGFIAWCCGCNWKGPHVSAHEEMVASFVEHRFEMLRAALSTAGEPTKGEPK